MNNETKCHSCKALIQLDDSEIEKKSYVCGGKNIITILSSGAFYSLGQHVENRITFLAYHPFFVVFIETLIMGIAVYIGFKNGNWMWTPIAGGIDAILYKKYIKSYE